MAFLSVHPHAQSQEGDEVAFPSDGSAAVIGRCPWTASTGDEVHEGNEGGQGGQGDEAPRPPQLEQEEGDSLFLTECMRAVRRA